MAGSSFGTIFRVTTWGESHGPAIGAVIDGCPAGISLCEDDFTEMMERRRPNGGALSTARNEPDRVEILSGVFEGMTTGTSIMLMIRSVDQHSKDYRELAEVFRPGHADFGYDHKYGIRDHRGGGRSSGRETAGRTAAGAVAEKMLSYIGISFDTVTEAIGGIPFTDPGAAALTDACRREGDSIGSSVVCRIHGVPAGLGEPVFGKLDAALSAAVFSIGSVKAVEIGDGCAVSLLKGSENNDPFYTGDDGRIHTASNHAGGILGGISTGGEIVLRAAFKPTPSISLPQKTVDRAGRHKELVIHGRHDPVIGPRAAVVVEAMAALVLADMVLLNQSARIASVRAFYDKN